MQGMYPYLYFGVCDGSHDVLGGWRATSDLGACLYSAFDGKKVVDGAFADFGAAANSRQAFPGRAGRLGLAVGSPRGGVPSLVAGEGRREAGGRGAEGLSVL